jgi:hypothetical protein
VEGFKPSEPEARRNQLSLGEDHEKYVWKALLDRNHWTCIYIYLYIYREMDGWMDR